MGDMTFGATLLKFSAQIGIDHTQQENARISRHTGKHRLDMVQAANQCPDMFRGSDIRELGDTSPCNLVYSFARRV